MNIINMKCVPGFDAMNQIFIVYSNLKAKKCTHTKKRRETGNTIFPLVHRISYGLVGYFFSNPGDSCCICRIVRAGILVLQ